jgi:hypothetical protein
VALPVLISFYWLVLYAKPVMAERMLLVNVTQWSYKFKSSLRVSLYCFGLSGMRLKRLTILTIL